MMASFDGGKNADLAPTATIVDTESLRGASFDKDLAAAIVPDHAQDVDSRVEKRVLRKIDLVLIPWMWIGYGFVYYDKVCAHSLQIFPGSTPFTFRVLV